MYRWPIQTAREGGRNGREAESLVLEVPARGAAFFLRPLVHLAHPIHLALIDAYLHGAVPGPPGRSLGTDSAGVVAGLAGPLVALDRLGVARATLSELVLLPPPRRPSETSRFLITAGREPVWLECATGLPHGGRPKPPAAPWLRVSVQLPDRQALDVAIAGATLPASLGAGWRGPPAGSSTGGARDPSLVAALRALDLGRAGRSSVVIRGAVRALERGVDEARDTASGDEHALLRRLLRDARAEAHRDRSAMGSEPKPSAADTTVPPDLPLDVSIAREPDGGSTLALLPRPLEGPGVGVASPTGAAVWATLEGLLGFPLEERRTEPIALRLVGPERATELLIGWSLVLPRNRRVFAAWLGSDGRAVIRLSPGGSATSER